MSDDLVAWLRVVLDEEDRRLVGSGDLGWLTFRRPDGSMSHTEAACRAGDEVWIVAAAERTGYASATVVHREADRRADLEAKRRIVDVCETDLRQRGDGALVGDVDRPTWDVLCLLALPYADRPGYRVEWRP